MMKSTERSSSNRKKWLGALAGGLAGPLDTALLGWLGVSFEINGTDAGWLIATYFGLSFAVLGYLLVAISEARARDREQARLLAEQRDTIHRTRARLAQSEKLAALGQLATMVAHEVRNPLGVMRSSAQEIGDTVDAASNAGVAISFIITEIDRLNHVIESILGFARPIQPNLDSVRIGDVVERAVQLAAEHRRQDCRIVIDRGLDPVARADADLVTQVVLDLIANALEVSPEGGEVHIDVRDGDEIVIGIVDQGPGIAPDLREKIFEPFYTNSPGGTGLGLAVSRQIAASHGGSLTVADAPSGARFEVRLPCDADEMAA